MRILVLGATGGTGRQLVGQALERGHEVTAFVRMPGKLLERPPRLRVVQGDIARPDTIRAAMPRQEAVVSALGVRTLRPSTLLSDALPEILSAMSASRVRRIVWESSLGVGETRGRPDAPAGRLFPRISRADVAHFMTGEIEHPMHIHRVVPLCY
jgi:putative NADH-flavin reductase